jgi:hypothetical protein
MTDLDLTGSISNALGNPDWTASVLSIKAILRAAIGEVDPQAEIVNTAYFNHSFVPDFVINWPRDARAASRDVFLRLNNDMSGFQDDLDHLGADRPMLMGLEPLPDALEPPVRQPSDAGSLITDPVAIQGLSNAGSERFGRLIPSAVLKGGRGLIDDTAAVRLTSSAQAIFEGAQNHDREVVSDAVDAVAPFLSTGTSRQVTNFARILWEATGGTPSDFPRQTELEGVDNDGLIYLLSEAPEDDLKFWRSIGATVNFGRLLQIVRSTPRNLRVLLAANLDRFGAGALMVKERDQRLPDERWAMTANGLLFRGENFDAYFAQKRGDLPRADTADALSLTTFRLRSGGHRVQSVTFSTDRETEIVVDSDIRNVADDRALELLEQDSGSQISRAVVAVGGKPLVANFVERVARGRTNARFSLDRLLEDAIPLLWDLSESDQTEILADLLVLEEAQATSALPRSELSDDVLSAGEVPNDPEPLAIQPDASEVTLVEEDQETE